MKRLFFLTLGLISVALLYAVGPSGTLPVMYIQTENNASITSKEDYLNATYYIDAQGISGYENVGSSLEPLTMEIKGRGNYSWTGFDKKPYRIKLTDGQPLLGMVKSKHFALLAHADDAKDKKGYMRNAVGFQLSEMIGMAWTPDAKPLELVLNGNYVGLYFLTEIIRVDKDRVNVVEQVDEETDPEKITGGWLVEIDNYDTDPHITIFEGGRTTMWLTYKTPEVLSYQQENYLTNQMQLIDNLVYGDKNSDALWKYLDMEALARFYIVQELTDNYESFHGSCYLYKEIGNEEKWKFGPVWDFGSAFNRDKSQYIYQGDVWHNHWIPEICKFPAFMQCVKTIWKDFYKSKFNDIYTFTGEQLTLLKTAAAVDAERWTEYNGNADLKKRINQVNECLRKNAEWLDEQWGSNEDNNDQPSDNPTDNPNDDPSDDGNFDEDMALMSMYVWQNGHRVEYRVAEVDSITFEKKEGIVVKVKVPDHWTDKIYVWVWNEGMDGNEQEAVKYGDWYTYTYMGNQLNIIFKNGRGWSGDPYQTENMHLSTSGCYILKQEGENKAQAISVDCSK